MATIATHSSQPSGSCRQECANYRGIHTGTSNRACPSGAPPVLPNLLFKNREVRAQRGASGRSVREPWASRRVFRCEAAPALRCRVAEFQVSSHSGREQRSEPAKHGHESGKQPGGRSDTDEGEAIGFGVLDGHSREDVAVVATGGWQNPGLYQEKGHLHTFESWDVQEACWGLREQNKICGTSILGVELAKAGSGKPQNCS